MFDSQQEGINPVTSVNMDCRDTNPEQSNEASMMDLYASSSGDYSREVFAIRNGGDDLGHHDDDPANGRCSSAPMASNGQPHTDTPPPALIEAPIIQSSDYKQEVDRFKSATTERILLLQEALMHPPTTNLATPAGKDLVNLTVDLTKEIMLQAENSHLALARNSTNMAWLDNPLWQDASDPERRNTRTKAFWDDNGANNRHQTSPVKGHQINDLCQVIDNR